MKWKKLYSMRRKYWHLISVSAGICRHNHVSPLSAALCFADEQNLDRPAWFACDGPLVQRTFGLRWAALFALSGNLPKVNFPSSLIGNEFRNLLDKTQNNVNVNQNIDPPTEVNNANNKVNSKVTNDTDLEYHNKRAWEGNSPVASRKKREMETEIERESEDEITNVAKPQSERPEIAPKPQPLPQQDPRLLASAARARERERARMRGGRVGGRGRETKQGTVPDHLPIHASPISHTLTRKKSNFISMLKTAMK